MEAGGKPEGTSDVIRTHAHKSRLAVQGRRRRETGESGESMEAREFHVKGPKDRAIASL